MTVEAALFGAIILHEMHSHSLCGVIVTMHEVTQVVCGAEPHKSDDQLHKYGISYSNSKQCLLASGYDLKLCLTSEECLCLSLSFPPSFSYLHVYADGKLRHSAESGLKMENKKAAAQPTFPTPLAVAFPGDQGLVPGV